MLPVFSFLKSLVRLRPVATDNVVFQLHYRWTVAILLAFSILVTLKQYWGDAILCKTNHHRPAMVKTFCWAESTFSIPSAYDLVIGDEVPYAGITTWKGDKTDIKYHAYYQWVGLTLFFQAVLFSIPRFMWKSEEGGLIKSLVSGLDVVVSKEDNEQKTTRLVTYLKASWRTHDKYVTKYLLCEMANFINVVGQMILMETFLGGEFSAHATETLGTKKNNVLDSGIRVFPRMAKCLFYDFGTSGDINKKDVLCILPLNVFNEKIYVFLFLWFLMLAILSGAVILVRLVSILQPEYREIALASRASLCRRSTIRMVCRYSSFSDWFFVKLICKNVSSQCCRHIIHGITEDLPIDNNLKKTDSISSLETEF